MLPCVSSSPSRTWKFGIYPQHLPDSADSMCIIHRRSTWSRYYIRMKIAMKSEHSLTGVTTDWNQEKFSFFFIFSFSEMYLRMTEDNVISVLIYHIRIYFFFYSLIDKRSFLLFFHVCCMFHPLHKSVAALKHLQQKTKRDGQR